MHTIVTALCVLYEIIVGRWRPICHQNELSKNVIDSNKKSSGMSLKKNEKLKRQPYKITIKCFIIHNDTQFCDVLCTCLYEVNWI